MGYNLAYKTIRNATNNKPDNLVSYYFSHQTLSHLITALALKLFAIFIVTALLKGLIACTLLRCTKLTVLIYAYAAHLSKCRS